MAKINKSIEIVCSPITSLSSISKISAQGILKVLKNNYTNVVITYVLTIKDLDAIIERSPDLVFLGTKRLGSTGQNPEDTIWIEEYFRQNGIACTGSDSQAHRLEQNKSLAKQRVLDVGLNTSPYYVIYQNTPSENVVSTLTYPLFIKPTDGCGGLGVDRYSVVHNIAQHDTKILSIATLHNSDSLVEQYLSGREFSVAILRKSNSSDFSLMPVELVAPINTLGARLLSSKVKNDDTEKMLPVKDIALRNKINTLALAVFHALGARDYGRIDIRLDDNGVPQFLEANLLPSLTEGYGSFPKSCLLNAGINYEHMILNIVELSFSRQINTPEQITAPTIASY